MKALVMVTAPDTNFENLENIRVIEKAISGIG